MVSEQQIAAQVVAALQEDLGAGDLTAALLPAGVTATARVIARQSAVLCGVAWFNAVFQQLDPLIVCDWHLQDGEQVSPDEPICELRGPARTMLTGERTALNLLQTLSGTATTAAQYVQAVAGTGVQIRDTRKTVPGLRLAQKYAVLCGGASNQRIGLYDAILIKENHIQAAGSIQATLAAAHAVAADVSIQIEVESLEELSSALSAGAESILLDNFALEQLRQAVQMNQGRAYLEASGGIQATTVRAVAETGVDAISVGDITKNVQSVDYSMRLG